MNHIPTATKKDDLHILKGGKVLDGRRLKAGDRLFPRRINGRTVLKFERFLTDGRVQLRKLRNGTPVRGASGLVVMTRRSLQGNYER